MKQILLILISLLVLSAKSQTLTKDSFIHKAGEQLEIATQKKIGSLVLCAIGGAIIGAGGVEPTLVAVGGVVLTVGVIVNLTSIYNENQAGKYLKQAASTK